MTLRLLPNQRVVRKVLRNKSEHMGPRAVSLTQGPTLY